MNGCGFEYIYMYVSGWVNQLVGEKLGVNGCGFEYIYMYVLGWVNTLVGGEKLGANGFGFFIVNVDLTEVGTGE